MIRFKQKEFIAPLLATAGKAAMSMAPDILNAGATAISNSQNNQIQQQALENQQKQQKEQNKILNKAVKKDPVGVASVLSQQQFSYLGRLGKKYAAQARRSVNDIISGLDGVTKDDFVGFGRDLKYSVRRNKDAIIGPAMASGAAILGSYLGNKAIKKYKDYKANQIKEQWLNELEEREYSVPEKFIKYIPPKSESVMEGLGRIANKYKGRIALGFAGGVAGAALPFAIQEYTKRQMAKQTKEEPEEREYSVKNKINYVKEYINNGVNAIRRGYRDVKNDPLKHYIKTFKSRVRPSDLNSFANDLESGGSKSKITSLVSKMIKKHPKTSLIVGSGVAYLGKKGVNKLKDTVHQGIKKIDKNAFSQESDYDYLTSPDLWEN